MFNGSMGMTIDSTGDLFVAENKGNRIRKVTLAGVVTTVAGSGLLGSTDGTGNLATFQSPFQITSHYDNFLYVPETIGKVRRVSKDGVVTSLIINGTVPMVTELIFPPVGPPLLTGLNHIIWKLETNCPYGTFSSGISCLGCPANTFSFGGSVTNCTTCPSNTFSEPGSSSCTFNCPSGKYVFNSACTDCPPNTFSVGGAT
jgi:hypothetical protein